MAILYRLVLLAEKRGVAGGHLGGGWQLTKGLSLAGSFSLAGSPVKTSRDRDPGAGMIKRPLQQERGGSGGYPNAL